MRIHRGWPDLRYYEFIIIKERKRQSKTIEEDELRLPNDVT